MAKKKKPAEAASLPSAEADVGLTLDRIYTIEQIQQVVPPSDGQEYPEERPVQLGWDWRIPEPGTFEVLLTLSVGPSTEFPERFSVSMVGSYSLMTVPSVENLLGFVRFGAPHQIFPFLRERVLALSGHGPFPAMLMSPLNVHAVMEQLDPEGPQGRKQLEDHPERLALPIAED